MPKYNPIIAGTVSLVKGSIDGLGLNTAFKVSNVQPGDMFNSSGLVGVIATIDDDTHFTLMQPWPGDTGSDLPYMIVRDGGGIAIVSNETRLEEIIRKIEAGLFLVPGDEGTLAERDAYDTEGAGFLYVVTDDASGDMVGYIKASATSGDWAGPFAWRGPQGEDGPQGPVGPAAEPSKTGLAAEQSNFDGEAAQFSFLAYDTSLLYFKLSAASGDWSTGIPWGKGDKGNTGELAIGTVTTGAAGSAAGAVNVGTPTNGIWNLTIPQGDKGYKPWVPIFSVQSDGLRRVQQITDWTDGEGPEPTIGQYVGLAGYVALIGDGVDIRGPQGLSGDGSGDVLAVNNLSDLASISGARSNLGIGSVDNTSDANKPISTAQQSAIGANTTEISANGTAIGANTTAIATKVATSGVAGVVAGQINTKADSGTLAGTEEILLGNDKKTTLQEVADLGTPTVNSVQNHVTAAVSYAASVDRQITELNTEITTTIDGARVDIGGFVSIEPGNNVGVLYLKRDGVEIGTAPDAGLRPVGLITIPYDANVNSTMTIIPLDFTDDDSGTAGPKLYTVHVRGPSSTLFLNRTEGDSDAADFERVTSNVKLTELPPLGA